MPSLKGITETILQILSEATFITSTVFSRKSFYEKSVLMEFGCKPWEINKGLKIFEKNKYLKNKSGRLHLTPKGRIKINFYKLGKIELGRQKKWDKKWRLIIFDIPEAIRTSRNVLRSKLKKWNCYKIQHSVFVYPYPCEEEIIKVAKILRTSGIYVCLVDRLDSLLEEKVKKH